MKNRQEYYTIMKEARDAWDASKYLKQIEEGVKYSAQKGKGDLTYSPGEPLEPWQVNRILEVLENKDFLAQKVSNNCILIKWS